MWHFTKNQQKWLGFVMALTEKEIKARYKMAIFGFLWILLNPLLQMLVMGFIFQFFVPVKTANYFEFLFPGLLAWNFFSYTVTKNTSMYINERALIQKARFPREAVVISVVLANMFHFLIALALFVLWEALVVRELHWFRWWLLPGIIVWLTMLTTGLSMLFSSLNVKWRDVNFGVQAIMPLWFYATPVVYSLDLLPQWLSKWIYLNPMTAVMEMLRWTTLGLGIEWVSVGWSLVVTIVVFIVGIMVFKKESPFFDDWL
ncbi:ABC transporter permease [Candidatus Shapirobacteria bacterium]|nr:ABC transporter permease [Candidatus Shapirobacteria bacterium]